MAAAEQAGERLARRHRPADADPGRSVIEVGERSHTEDWTLRSALVRFAQPEPVRAAAVLELVRRCDGAVRPLVRGLDDTTVVADAALTPSALDDDPGHGGRPAEPYPDLRIVDVARFVRSGLPAPEVVAGYSAVTPLGSAEIDLIPLLQAMLDLDDLGRELAAWAEAGAGAPPTADVDATCATVAARLDALGIGPERAPDSPPRRRPSSA
ncbi:MAG: hypothetical protein ACFCVK_11955 [Acidimicrobiales bacterium]